MGRLSRRLVKNSMARSTVTGHASWTEFGYQSVQKRLPGRLLTFLEAETSRRLGLQGCPCFHQMLVQRGLEIIRRTDEEPLTCIRNRVDAAASRRILTDRRIRERKAPEFAGEGHVYTTFRRED